MVFKIASSPFIHNQRSTARIMMQVALAALPGIVTQWYWFGWGTLIQVVLGIVSAMVAEALVLRLRKKSVLSHLRDNSALLTGLLLGISIPPLVPWWMMVSGMVFAIIIAKQLYGGLGNNPFNPAMMGYVVLLISFPLQMTSWPPPRPAVPPPGLVDSLQMIFHGVDGVRQATPLNAFKTAVHTGQPAEQLLNTPAFARVLAGPGWQWVNLAYLVGGLFLLWRGTIRWPIPAGFLAALVVCSAPGWLISAENYPSPAAHLFSGATMLGAFFILTDPVTASTTNSGRLIYGALAGLLVWLSRSYGGYPDGLAFAVLLSNITVPLIDYYTRPRPYGHH